MERPQGMARPLAEILLTVSEQSQGQNQLTPEQVSILQELIAKSAAGQSKHPVPVEPQSSSVNPTRNEQPEDDGQLYSKISDKVMTLMPPEATAVILAILYNERKHLKILNKLYDHEEEFVRYCQVLLAKTKEEEVRKYFETIQIAVKENKDDEKSAGNDSNNTPKAKSDALVRATPLAAATAGAMYKALKIASNNADELAVALQVLVKGDTIVSVLKFVPYVKWGGLGLIAFIGTCEVAYQVYRYKKGEISGRILGRNVSEIGVNLGIGCGAGIAAGFVVSFFLTPLAGVIAGVAAGIAVPLISRKLIRNVISRIFNVPVKQAVVDAYHYFKLERDSSEEEIKKAFRQMRLQHHPDRGGNKEEFIKMSMYMNLITIDLSEIKKKKTKKVAKPTEGENSTNSESAGPEILALPWEE